MSVIKKFFLKKKEEAAFKLKIGGSLGQGHSLSAQNPETSSSSRRPADEYIPPKRKELSKEAKAAAAAAVARVERKSSKEVNTSLAAIKAQAKKELEAARKVREEMPSSETISEISTNTNFACDGVLFRCPIVDEEVLPKKEWKNKINTFLHQQLESEKALTSCLIIHNCNNKENAKNCVTTLSKYLENIIQFPGEEKYCKIRLENRVFCENVRYVEGAMDFLFAAGFREVDLDNEKYLIWWEENVEKGYTLNELLEALKNSEPFQLVLDRNIKVLFPSQAENLALPPDFYRMSPEEIKREQQCRAEAIESALTLKTKAMREREAQKTLRMYRYSLIRVKFPDGLLIQGTFNVCEKLSDVFEFVQSCLYDEDLKFSLVAPAEGKFTDEDMDKALYDLGLVPNILLLFNAHNENVYASKDNNYLKEDLLLLALTL